MTYHSKIIAGGKIVIPASIRRELGFEEGDTIVVRREGDSVVLKSRAQILDEVQANIRRHLKKPVTVDGFITERRAEAARD